MQLSVLQNNVVMILIILFTCSSCSQKSPDTVRKVISQDTIDHRMMNVNSLLTTNENEQIEAYIKRYGWEMKATGSGLRYLIYKQGNGKPAKKNHTIKINYRTALLNGVTVYNSAFDGAKIFKMGKADVEVGLEEGILLLKVGDKAKFIIPSHLAFGLVGDQKKIPRKATLVYDVELLEVN